MTRLISIIAALSALFAIAEPAWAQRFRVRSVTTADMGNVASASSGTTAFRINPANGMVTKVTGAGVRLSSGSARSLVTVRCNNKAKCNSRDALVTITFTGTPTNRAGALNNFKVSTSGATATITSAPGAGSSISFRIGPVGRSRTKTFWVGFDLPVLGDNSGALTGLSKSQFVVTVSRVNGSRPHSRTGMGQANVFRSLSIAKTADLAFGAIIRPTSGAGIVSLDAATGNVSVVGTGTMALGTPASSAAAFSISGEGGQSISVFVPSSIVMSGSSGALTVNTTTDPGALTGLSGTLGTTGNLDLNIGGAFNLSSTTSTGPYSGVLPVTVQYN